MAEATTTKNIDGNTITNIDMVTYGDLMQMVDSNNRWVYKGSVTTPPCGRFVYWNVLSTVYPIS
jgi:carbonic anhydrase